MALILTDMQKVTLAISPVSAAGNPAVVETVEWGTTNPDILEVTPSEDGLSAVVVTVGPTGVAQVVVTADADLGEGVVELTGLLDVEVVPSQAVSLGIAAGVPVAK